MSIPENLKGQHHPRDPIQTPRPRMPLGPDGRPMMNAGTAANPHPASGQNVRTS